MQQNVPILRMYKYPFYGHKTLILLSHQPLKVYKNKTPCSNTFWSLIPSPSDWNISRVSSSTFQFRHTSSKFLISRHRLSSFVVACLKGNTFIVRFRRCGVRAENIFLFQIFRNFRSRTYNEQRVVVIHCLLREESLVYTELYFDRVVKS